tara:strand:- start:1819 stop:2736 length:918 start_codon:yes stop_codon:yes gene_type:complete
MNINDSTDNKELDLTEILITIWDNKKLIAIVTSIAAVISVIVALMLPNIYVSKTLLTPTSQEDSLSSKLSGLSSFAGIAGVAIPKAGSNKSEEGVERIKSFEFFSTYVLPKIELENIVAVKKWVPQDNTIVYDKKIYDQATNKWPDGRPSAQDAYKSYAESLTVIQDKKTSFVSVSIEHYSPYIAQKWVSIIIKEINESMRKLDSDQAEKSIAYLNESAQTTNIQPIREAIAKLLESQMRTLMLTASSEAYIFKVIDSPIVPEKKSKPSRSIICILGTILGGLFSLMIVFIRQFFNQNSIKSYSN